MATRTVGAGKTYATIVAAHAAASDGDTIEVYANTSGSSYGENNLTITKGVTIVGMLARCAVTLTWARVLTVGSGAALNGTLTFRNLNIYRSGWDFNITDGSVTFDRCIINVAQDWIEFANSARTGTYRFDNCLFLYGHTQFVLCNTGSGGNLLMNFCSFKGGDTAAVTFATATLATIKIRNCDGIGAGTAVWSGVTGESNSFNNASGDTTTCGTGGIVSKTVAEGAYVFNGGIPSDILATSALYHAGATGTGVTVDIYNRTRHASTPSIGCFEGPGYVDPGVANVLNTTTYYLDGTAYVGTYDPGNAPTFAGASSLVDNGDRTLTVQWTAGTGTIDSYEIHVHTSSMSDAVLDARTYLAQSVDATATSAIIAVTANGAAKLTAGTTYYVVVRARNNAVTDDNAVNRSAVVTDPNATGGPIIVIPDPTPISLNTSATTIYEVPTGKRAVLLEVCLCNTDSATRTVTLYKVKTGDTAAADTMFLDAFSLTAKGTLGHQWNEITRLSLTEGTKIQGLASSNGKVTAMASAIEVTP